jgi:homogentisate 1,2-dioxygenase
MAGHGPEEAVFEKASDTSKKQEPQFIGANGMAFMFETTFLMKLTDYSKTQNKDEEYIQHSWATLRKNFNPNLK